MAKNNNKSSKNAGFGKGKDKLAANPNTSTDQASNTSSKKGSSKGKDDIPANPNIPTDQTSSVKKHYKCVVCDLQVFDKKRLEHLRSEGHSQLLAFFRIRDKAAKKDSEKESDQAAAKPASDLFNDRKLYCNACRTSLLDKDNVETHVASGGHKFEVERLWREFNERAEAVSGLQQDSVPHDNQDTFCEEDAGVSKKKKKN